MVQNILRAFYTDTRLWFIVGLIVADVVTGIIAALRLGVFRWDKVFTFYRTMVVPAVLGYLVLVWLPDHLVLRPDGISDTIVREVLGMLAQTFGVSVVYASLVASIIDNVQRYRADVTPTDVSDMRYNIDVTYKG